MKSFLDRFRRKGSDDEAADRKTESARDLAAEALQKRAAKAEVATETKPAAPAPATPSAEGAAVTPNRDETITFTLGDFLPRIPTQLLVAGEHDATATLTFDVAELSARIAKGQTTIPLCEVYRRAPKIFRGEIRESDNIEIRFPWQKLLELVKAANSPNPQPGLTEAAAEALAQKLRGRKRPGGATAPAPAALAGAAAGGANAGKQPNWFSRPTPAGAPTPEAKPAPAASETPVPAAAAAQTPATEAPAAIAAAPAPTLAPAPQAPPGAMTETQVANEIERICQSADEEIARLRNGFQETVSLLEQDKTKLLAERDQAVADLAAARRKEAAQAVASATFADQDTLKKEIEALRANVEAKSQEIHSLQAQLNDAHLLSGTEAAAATQEQDQEINALRAEADARDRELSALRQRLEQIENTAQGAVQQRTTADEQVRTLTKELDDLRAEAKTQGSQLSQEQANFAQLQKTAEAGLAAVTSERDQLKTRADAQQAEVGALQQRLEQFSQAAKAELGEADAEREKLRNEAEILLKNLAAAQGELDELKKTHEEQTTTLGKERDAFNQQKQHFADQVTQLQKAENSRSESHRQEGDASRRENQRQVEELQRRILGLETTQKEVAQELSKERELRIKAERNASAADRARTETTALLESTRNDARRDAETRNRKQDGELSRVQKDLQERIDSLSESQSKIKAERDELQSEVNRLKAAEATAGDWQSQTVASLEADVASYRDRIKALLKERDEWQKQHEHSSTAHTAGTAALTALQAVHDQLSGETTTLRGEHQGLTTRVSDLEAQLTTGQGEIESLRQQLATASKEAGEGATTLTKLREELAALEKTRATSEQNFTLATKERDTARQQNTKLQAELDGLKKAQADLSSAKTAQEEEFQKVRTEAGAAETTLREKLTATEAQLAEAAQQRDVDRKRAEKLQIEIDELAKRPAVDPAVAAEFEKLKTDFASAQKSHSEGLEKVRTESAAAAASLNEKLTQADQAKAEFEKQLAEAALQRDAAQKRAGKLQAEVDELAKRPAVDPAIAAELDKLKADFASAQKSHTEGLEKVRNDSSAQADKAKADFEKQLSESTQQRDAARKRVEKLQAEVDELMQRPAVDPAVAAEFEKLKADFASAQQGHTEGLEKFRSESATAAAALNEKLAQADKAKAELEKQLSESTQQRDAARKRVEKLQAEVDELMQRPAVDPAVAAELEQLKADFASAQQGHTEGLEKVRGESTATTAALNEKLVQADKAKAEFEKQLAESTQQRDAARKRVEKLQAEVDELMQRPAVDPAVAAELEQVKAEFTASRQTHTESVLKARSESTAAIKALSDKVDSLEKAKTTLDQSLAEAGEQRDAARKRVEKLQAEVDEFAKRPAVDPAVAAELEKVKGDLAAAQQSLTAAVAESTQQLAAARESHDQELKKIRSESAAAAAALNEKVAALEKAKGAVEVDLFGVVEQRDTARKRVEKLQTEVDEFAKRPVIDPAVVAELEKVKAELAAAQQKSSADQQKAAADLTAAQQKSASDLAALQQKATSDQQKAAADLAAAQQKAASELAALQQKATDDLQKAAGELAAAQQKAAAELAAAQQKAAADLAALNEKLTARDQARVAHERELAALREQIGTGAAELEKTKAASEAALTGAREQHASELQAAQSEASTAAASLVQLRQQLGGFEITRTALEQSVATIARDRDDVAAKVRDLEARVQAAEAAASAKAEELAQAKTESDQVRAAVQAEVEKAAEGFRKERDEMAAELTATRERTRSLLSSNEKENRAALTSLTEERDASRRDSATIAQRLAEARIEAEQKAAQQQQQIDKLKGDLEKLAGELARARETFEQQSAVFARELKTVSDQRDKAVATIDTNQREMREKAAGLDESRAQAERVAEDRIGRLDREVIRLRRERDQVSEQRDELRDRISAMADAQQRLVKEIALQATKTAPQPTDVVQKARDPRESNVIDISEAEVLQPGEPESDTGGVRPPRLRPVMVPPPNVRVL